MMPSSSADPFSFFPASPESERPLAYQYRKKSITVRPSHYGSYSYSSSPRSSVAKSYLVRSSSSAGVPSFSAMGFFKEKDRGIWEHDSLPLPSQPPGPSNGNDRSAVPRRFKMTTLNKVKWQRSLASVRSGFVNDASIYSVDPLSPGSVSPVLGPDEARDMTIEDLETSHQQEGIADRLRVNSRFRRRHGTALHPYPQEAPYMQSYDPVLLDNDRYNDCLLQRLTLNTPSFRDYGRRPPSNVLDLGCGEGRWVFETAAAWRGYGTKVTGFDLMYMWVDEKIADNVKFVRGNFVKHGLPFADYSFDFVRMANLFLCIPFDRWEFVLHEVKRVLSSDGRLELIDDHIFFPYEKTPVRPPITQSTPSSGRSFTTGSFLDVEEDENEDEESGESDIVEMEDIDSIPTSVESDPEILSPLDKLGLKLQGPYPIPLPDPYAEWEKKQASSKCLETLYGRMLKEKYGIHIRPSDFIRDLMACVFGKRSVNKVTSLHLSLAPPGESSDREREEDQTSLKSPHSSAPSSLVHSKEAWANRNWVRRDKKGESRSSGELSYPALSGSPMPVGISVKAAARLGISPGQPEPVSAKAAGHLGTSVIRRQLFTPRHQTTGLVLWPSTFIPMSPSELEMHVCRHMHVLLGCKAALAEYITTYTDENNKRLIGDKEFEDMIWDYECFRRQRFHWPSDVPEVNLDELEPVMKSSTLRSESSSRSLGPVKYRRDELRHVRTIRVYEAFKTAGDMFC